MRVRVRYIWYTLYKGIYAERNVFAKLRSHITSTFNGAVKQIVICEQIFRVEIVFKIFFFNLLEERASFTLYDYFLLHKLEK